MWRISEKGNTLGLEKNKTTAVGSASYCFWGLTSYVDSIFEEVVGFSPFMVSPIKNIVFIVCYVLLMYLLFSQ